MQGESKGGRGKGMREKVKEKGGWQGEGERGRLGEKKP